MFNRDSILYQVNVISKILGIILSLVSIIYIQIPGLIVLISIILLLLSSSFKFTFRYSMISLAVSIFISFYPPFLWISKILIFINYLILIKKITNTSDLRYMLEVTLYKFQSKKITYHILYVIYFFKYIKKNHKVLSKLRDEYGIHNDWFYIRFSWKKAYLKTKHEMNELMIINNLRFYNYSSKRTYLERPTWERWDSGYLLFHLSVLVFSIVYGGML